MQKSEVDYHDPEIMTDSCIWTSLLQAVAHGRIFVQRSDGELERVCVVSYERDGGFRSTSADWGYEVDEDGNITRRFTHGDTP